MYFYTAAWSLQHNKRYEEGISMAKSKIARTNEKIAEKVTGTFEKIENTVIGSYTKIEDAFVDMYLTRDGETVEEAKARLKSRK